MQSDGLESGTVHGRPPPERPACKGVKCKSLAPMVCAVIGAVRWPRIVDKQATHPISSGRTEETELSRDSTRVT